MQGIVCRQITIFESIFKGKQSCITSYATFCNQAIHMKYNDKLPIIPHILNIALN